MLKWTMGRTLQVRGDKEHYPEDMTIQELKEDAGLPLDDVLRYDRGGQTVALSDRDTVGDIPEDARLSTITDNKAYFG